MLSVIDSNEYAEIGSAARFLLQRFVFTPFVVAVRLLLFLQV